jgi:hypothetical protein
VSGYSGAAPHGVDAAAVCRAAGELATRIDSEGLDAVGAEVITVRVAPGRP